MMDKFVVKLWRVKVYRKKRLFRHRLWNCHFWLLRLLVGLRVT